MGVINCFHYGADRIGSDEDELPFVFSGLYYGDYNKLLGRQKKCIGSMDSNEWDKLRMKIFEMESSFECYKTKNGYFFNPGRLGNDEKIKERLKLHDRQFNLVNALAVLNRVPPSLEEAKKYIMSREVFRNNLPLPPPS